MFFLCCFWFHFPRALIAESAASWVRIWPWHVKSNGVLLHTSCDETRAQSVRCLRSVRWPREELELPSPLCRDGRARTVHGLVSGRWDSGVDHGFPSLEVKATHARPAARGAGNIVIITLPLEAATGTIHDGRLAAISIGHRSAHIRLGCINVIGAVAGRSSVIIHYSVHIVRRRWHTRRRSITRLLGVVGLGLSSAAGSSTPGSRGVTGGACHFRGNVGMVARHRSNSRSWVVVRGPVGVVTAVVGVLGFVIVVLFILASRMRDMRDGLPALIGLKDPVRRFIVGLLRGRNRAGGSAGGWCHLALNVGGRLTVQRPVLWGGGCRLIGRLLCRRVVVHLPRGIVGLGSRRIWLHRLHAGTGRSSGWCIGH